jgi:hypothetical protein
MNKKTILFALVGSGLFTLGVQALNAEPEGNAAQSTSMDGDWVGRLSEKIANLKIVIHIKKSPSAV